MNMKIIDDRRQPRDIAQHRQMTTARVSTYACCRALLCHAAQHMVLPPASFLPAAQCVYRRTFNRRSNYGRRRRVQMGVITQAPAFLRTVV